MKLQLLLETEIKTETAINDKNIYLNFINHF